MAVLNIKGLPDGLYRKLQARAKRNHRSVAQEVTSILEQAVTRPEPRSILDLEGLGQTLWAPVDATRHVAEERESWG